MTKLDIKGIRERVKAFKHWKLLEPDGHAHYEESPGPDFEALLDALEKMAGALKKISADGDGLWDGHYAADILKELGLE